MYEDSIYTLIHHSAQNRSESSYYYKGKQYTEKEYFELIHRKQLMKNVAITIMFGVIIVFRIHVFLKYGI